MFLSTYIESFTLSKEINMKEKVELIYDKVLGMLVKILGIALVLIVLLQITARYLPTNAFIWTEEMARLLFLWFSFLGTGLTLTKKMHLGIDFFYDRLSKKGKVFAQYFGMIVMLGFSLVLVYFGFKLVSVVSIQRSPVFGLSMSLFYAPVPVAGLLFSVYIVADLIDTLRGKELASV